MGQSSSTTKQEVVSPPAQVAALKDAREEEGLCSNDTLAALSFTTTPEARLPIIYSDQYNIGFWGMEKLHPFDSAKYEKVIKALTHEYHLLTMDEMFQPIEVPNSVLRLVHTPDYLKSLTSSMNVARILEVPPVAALPNALVQSKALRPMRYATAGTILGAELAMRGQRSSNEEQKESSAASSPASPTSSSSTTPVPRLAEGVARGWAINVGGGFHHCSAQSGGGFCPYADITLALVILAKKFGLKKAMIVDLDAHQGNGHENDKLNGVYSKVGLDVFILDMFNASIYPFDRPAMEAIDCPVRLRRFTQDEEYLSKLRKHLKASLDKFQPQFILYNAGSDCLTGDPLGQLDISPDGIVERDSIVFRMAFERQIPILMALSGGYQKSNAGVIASSIAHLHASEHLWQLDPQLANLNSLDLLDEKADHDGSKKKTKRRETTKNISDK